MSVQALYQQKKMSPGDAIQFVKDGDTIVVPTGVGGLERALADLVA